MTEAPGGAKCLAANFAAIPTPSTTLQREKRVANDVFLSKLAKQLAIRIGARSVIDGSAHQV